MYAPGFHFRLLSASELSEQHGYLEFRDLDHHEWSEDFQKDETDYREWHNAEKGKALSHCESVLSSEINHQDQDQDPNTTDPFLAHELFVPYNRMPRPRLLRANGKNSKYIVTALSRRPRSPVRHVLSGRFDLCTRTEELLKRQSIIKARRYLRESKDRILQSVKQISDTDVDFDLIICTLVLRALCEQVILTMAEINTGMDVRIFVNMAIISVLADLQILDPVTLNEQERTVFIKLFDARPRSREVVACSKLRRDLFEVHRPKFGLHILTHLHYCLPWALVGPAHQRGIIKSYPNVRERIDEKLSDLAQYVKSAYVPDLTCFHFREVPDKTYVAYEKKFKAKKDQSRAK